MDTAQDPFLPEYNPSNSTFQEFDLHGTPLGPIGNTGLRENSIAFRDPAAAAKYFRNELAKQKAKTGTIGPKSSIAGSALAQVMEGWGADPSTIKRWIGENNYEGPPPIDAKLEENMTSNWGSAAGQQLAAQGRNGDDHVAHLQTGEMVVPPVITPELRAALMAQMKAAGIDPNQYTVGGGMSINPMTGLPEFGFGKAFKKVGKLIKKVASSPLGQIAIPIIASVALPGIGTALGTSISAAGGAAIGSGLATAASGGSFGQIIGSAAGSYLGSSIGGPGSGTIGSNLNQAGYVGLTNTLGRTISDTAISSATGGFLGSSFGNALGGMIDPPKMATPYNNQTANVAPSPAPAPTGSVGTGSGVAVPTGGAGAGTSTVNVPYNYQGDGSGINYTTQVRDRDTGGYRTVNTPFQNNYDRRNGWGSSGISFA